MSQRQGWYEVAVGKRAVYVRAHGLASMNNCLCLRDFLDHLLEEGHTFLVVDLADCTGMDSTFMGVLAGVATHEQEGKSPGVAVVNADVSLHKLLKSVGLTELLFVESEAFKAPDLAFVRLEEQPSEEERIRLIKSAHDNLIKISDENEKLFGPLVAALEMEMKDRGIQTG